MKTKLYIIIAILLTNLGLAGELDMRSGMYARSLEELASTACSKIVKTEKSKCESSVRSQLIKEYKAGDEVYKPLLVELGKLDYHNIADHLHHSYFFNHRFQPFVTQYCLSQVHGKAERSWIGDAAELSNCFIRFRGSKLPLAIYLACSNDPNCTDDLHHISNLGNTDPKDFTPCVSIADAHKRAACIALVFEADKKPNVDENKVHLLEEDLRACREQQSLSQIFDGTDSKVIIDGAKGKYRIHDEATTHEL